MGLLHVYSAVTFLGATDHNYSFIGLLILVIRIPDMDDCMSFRELTERGAVHDQRNWLVGTTFWYIARHDRISDVDTNTKHISESLCAPIAL